MYDLIGDIHGHAKPLKRLLQKLGYQEMNDTWQHPERKVIFVGDYIDRGPQIRETLQIVRSMTDTGNAIALLGNHEYNALAYHHRNEEGNYLRKHNEKNYHQHKETISQFQDYPEEWQQYLSWFKTLPLYFETQDLRAIHACWDDKHIQWLKDQGITTMSDELLISSHQKGTLPYKVIEESLKGKEIILPNGSCFKDKDGTLRKEARLKWWSKCNGQPYRDFIFDCPDDIKDLLAEEAYTIEYPNDAPPVFVGHYWLKDESPRIQTEKAVCLDYSIAKGGHLVAYRWNVGEPLGDLNFVYVRDDKGNKL